MICPKCGSEMLINEWGGWRWKCFICDYDAGPATTKEIDEQTEWIAQVEKRLKENKEREQRNEERTYRIMD